MGITIEKATEAMISVVAKICEKKTLVIPND
jgi:hypothetical protein